LARGFEGLGVDRFFSDAATECERQEQATAKAKAIISRCGFAFASAFGRVEVASRRVLDAGLKCRSTQKQKQEQPQRRWGWDEVWVEKLISPLRSSQKRELLRSK